MISSRPESCSVASLACGEPLVGSASEVRGYLLLEHGGPWGRKALEESAFPGPDGEPTDLGQALAQTLQSHGLTPLLVRRHGAAPGVPRCPTVMLVAFRGTTARGARTVVDGVHELRAWDVAVLLSRLERGEVPEGWSPLPTQFLVCTHGRRDACCAELGRPLAAVLDGLAHEQTWEVSHLGGHRLAANVLVVPDGVLYGRVDPDDALGLVAAHGDGRVAVELLRGRAGLAPPLQVAEVALRGATGHDETASVRLLDHDTAVTGTGTRTTSSWQAGTQTWRVVVDTAPGTGGPRPASCGALQTPAPDAFTVVEVTDVESAGRGAAGWDAAHTAGRGARSPHETVVDVVSSLPVGSALDVACGTGRHALWLAEHGWRVAGVDFSGAGLRRAQEEARRRGLDVDLQLGDARVWAPAQPSDLVLMAFVHLEGALARAASWVAPGGHLVVVGHARRNLTDGVGGPSDPRLLHDPARLREVSETAGLDVLRCEEVARATPDGTAIDAVLVARRPWRTAPSSTSATASP